MMKTLLKNSFLTPTVKEQMLAMESHVIDLSEDDIAVPYKAKGNQANNIGSNGIGSIIQNVLDDKEIVN